MRAFLRLLILGPVAVLIVLLCLANRQPVTLSFDPFASDVPLALVSVPLFVAMLGALMLGVILGGVGTWLAQGRYRRSARVLRREKERLEADTERLRTMLPATASLPPAR